MWHLGTGVSAGFGSTGLPKSLWETQSRPVENSNSSFSASKGERGGKSTCFHWCRRLGCSSLAKNDTTLLNSFQLLQEANEQTRASFNPSPLWELDLWAHPVYVRFLEGVKTIKRFKQRSIILGGKQSSREEKVFSKKTETALWI